MKLKNVNILERHIEKAILAVGVLFGLAVAWRLVLNDPYAVEIASESVTARAVETRVLDVATELDRRLNSQDSSLPDISIAPYYQMFVDRLNYEPQAVALLPPLAEWGVTIQIQESPDQLAKDPPIPQAPDQVTARAGFGVLIGSDLIAQRFGENASQQFAGIIAEQKPRDFSCVAIQSRYDMGSWRAKLRDVSTIPVQWWRDKLLLTDVVDTHRGCIRRASSRQQRHRRWVVEDRNRRGPGVQPWLDCPGDIAQRIDGVPAPAPPRSADGAAYSRVQLAATRD